jgi:cell division protein FtsW (lipid II flippase)
MKPTVDFPPIAHSPGPDSSVRRRVYVLLIVVAAATALGRILSAQLVYEPSLSEPWPNDPGHYRRSWPATPPRAMPTFSSNDRSRWAAVRALVDERTWVIGRRDRQTGKDSGIIFEDGWQSVDKMLNPDTLEFYSTKPPLLTFLVACEYWLLKTTFGWSLAGESEQRFSVVRVCLLTFNLLPFVVYLGLLARLVERFGSTDWGRLFVLTAACFGTLVTPFLITLNNHTLAACSVVVAVYAAVRILSDAQTSWRWFVLAGFFAGFTAVNELPAVAFAAGLGLLFLVRDPKRTILEFVSAALVPVAALFALNYAELGDFKLAYSKFGTEWYEYEGSHWRSHAERGNEKGQPKRGIDWAKNKEDKPTYAFHLLLGHHGWFSLTPIYLLALGGMGLGVWRLSGGRKPPERSLGGRKPPERSLGGLTPPAQNDSRQWAELAVSTAVLSLVVIGYYIYKSDNYSGWSNGPRWFLWLSPLWLLTLVPIVDRLGQTRGGRALCLVLLALSVLSAHYWDWNPWRHPWIYNWMDSRGWIPY